MIQRHAQVKRRHILLFVGFVLSMLPGSTYAALRFTSTVEGPSVPTPNSDRNLRCLVNLSSHAKKYPAKS